MKIEKIKKQADGKYKITFDNDDTVSTYDDVILNNNLLYKNEIDYDLFNKVMKETTYYDVYNKTINYILTRIRSESEIKTYLAKFNLSDKDNKTILANLTKIGFINDKLFARSYVNDKIKFTTMGPSKIKSDLMAFQINEQYIDEAINNIDKEIIIDKLTKIISKKIKSNTKYSIMLLKNKVSYDLLNNGYDMENIVMIFDSLSKNIPDILNIQYEKAYKALSKKYSGYELLAKIKQKLAQKGFSYQEIIDFIANKNNT